MESGGWFVSPRDLQNWLTVMDGDDDWTLEDGWSRTAAPWECGSGVVRTHIQYDRTRLLRELGDPLRSFDGFCHSEDWGLVSPSGHGFMVHRCSEVPDLDTFSVDAFTPIGVSCGAEEAIRSLGEYLDLRDRPDFVEEDERFSLPMRWRVIRLDDNNNEVEVSRHFGRTVATRVAREFESRGHKQSYWVEPIT